MPLRLQCSLFTSTKLIWLCTACPESVHSHALSHMTATSVCCLGIEDTGPPFSRCPYGVSIFTIHSLNLVYAMLVSRQSSPELVDLKLLSPEPLCQQSRMNTHGLPRVHQSPCSQLTRLVRRHLHQVIQGLVINLEREFIILAYGPGYVH